MTPSSHVPDGGVPLSLGDVTFGVGQYVVMAVVNRTTDSFYAPARFGTEPMAGGHDEALAAVGRAVDEGADLVDVGGIRAGRGPEVTASEEIDRVIPFIERVRAEFPRLLLSVDTWRAEVAEAAADAGVHLINDTWAGHDPRVVEVAGRRGLGVVVSHTGGLAPRTDPYRVEYPGGVTSDVVRTLAEGARRALGSGVRRESILIDPTHDFGKNTWHSLELVRNAQELVSLGFPVLMALSRKDFVGETLGLGVDERLNGTLAATAIAAWLGARVFRVHDVRAAREVLDMVASIRGDRPPVRAVRGLA